MEGLTNAGLATVTESAASFVNPLEKVDVWKKYYHNMVHLNLNPLVVLSKTIELKKMKQFKADKQYSHDMLLMSEFIDLIK